jgi:hypothetical protein
VDGADGNGRSPSGLVVGVAAAGIVWVLVESIAVFLDVYSTGWRWFASGVVVWAGMIVLYWKRRVGFEWIVGGIVGFLVGVVFGCYLLFKAGLQTGGFGRRGWVWELLSDVWDVWVFWLWFNVILGCFGQIGGSVTGAVVVVVERGVKAVKREWAGLRKGIKIAVNAVGGILTAVGYLLLLIANCKGLG